MEKIFEVELTERLLLFIFKIEITKIYCFAVFLISGLDCNVFAYPTLKLNRQGYLNFHRYQEIKGGDFMETEMYFISYKNLYEIYHP